LGDHNRFIENLLHDVSNIYFTGDGCRLDSGRRLLVMGRIDDVVNVSGHRTAPPRSRARWSASESGRGRRGADAARHQRPGSLRLRHAQDGVPESEELKKE